MKQSKIGMIGCGMISEVYAKNITERFGDLQLVACADLRMEAAQARAEQFGAKAMTVDELLADPDIDIEPDHPRPARRRKHGGAESRQKCVQRKAAGHSHAGC